MEITNTDYWQGYQEGYNKGKNNLEYYIKKSDKETEKYESLRAVYQRLLVHSAEQQRTIEQKDEYITCCTKPKRMY